MWNMNPFTYPVAGFVLTFCDVKVASPVYCMLLTSICLGLFFQLHAFQIFRMWFLSFSLDSTESLWGIICKELFLIVGLDEAIASGQMKLIQNELDCIEESGYAKFLAIEITRARYALQVSANSYDKIIPLPYLFKVYYRQQTKFAKVMFLHVSVILSTRGGGIQHPRRSPGPHTVGSLRDLAGGVSGYPNMHWGRPPHSWWLLLRAVRILLECILVMAVVTQKVAISSYWRVHGPIAFNFMSFWGKFDKNIYD